MKIIFHVKNYLISNKSEKVRGRDKIKEIISLINRDEGGKYISLIIFLLIKLSRVPCLFNNASVITA